LTRISSRRTTAVSSNRSPGGALRDEHRHDVAQVGASGSS